MGKLEVIRLGIPTLNQYQPLAQLLQGLGREVNSPYRYEAHIIDNGGSLLNDLAINSIKAAAGEHLQISIETPSYNLGVARSFNLLISKLGHCIISNDDVRFSHQDVTAFLGTSKQQPEAVLIENSDPISGFSTFFVNRPEIIQAIGGFDELFSPAYFEDNDMRRRLLLSGHQISRAHLPTWEHETSSTLKKGSEFYKRMHWCNFYRNRQYYALKWGGTPGNEQHLHPFGLPPAQ